jgi:tetratricopeptide (TPR) repeat protein
MLAEVQFHLGRLDDCRKLTLALLDEGNDVPLARIALAALDVLQRTGDPVTQLKRAEELEGTPVTQLVLMGQLYLGLRRRVDAARVLDAAIALEPTCAAAHTSRAIAYLYTGDAISAERHARTAVALHADSAQAQYCLGLALAKLGRISDAINAFKSGLSLEPKDAAWAHGRLADLYERQGDSALALHHRANADRHGRRRRPNLNLQWISEGLFQST